MSKRFIKTKKVARPLHLLTNFPRRTIASVVQALALKSKPKRRAK